MKTSSKIILEDINLNKDFRFNIEMLDNDRLKDNLYSILSNLDDFNNKDAKESDKLFALESVVNDFIKLTNALVSDYLFKQNLTIYKQQKNIDLISQTINNIENKLKKLSSIPSLTIKSLNREKMIGEKVKFLIKKYKQDYQNFERADNFPYRSFLKYDDFKGRIATIIDLVKEDYFGVEYFIYKLELDDNKEIVYLKVSEYKNFNYQDIGFVSLLDKARNMYLGKTFWKEKIIDLVEYKISKITFAGDDGEVFRNGAFNVHLETKRYFNRSEGTVLFNSQKPKVINVNFSKMYSLVEKDNSNPKEKVFENIFDYLEE